jgi:outer membrane protein TolC
LLKKFLFNFWQIVPTLRQAELLLKKASKLDVGVARANFYPGFTLRAGLGISGFQSCLFDQSQINSHSTCSET